MFCSFIIEGRCFNLQCRLTDPLICSCAQLLWWFWNHRSFLLYRWLRFAVDCFQTGASRSSGAEVQAQVRHSRGVDHGQGGPATGAGLQAVSSQRTQGETVAPPPLWSYVLHVLFFFTKMVEVGWQFCLSWIKMVQMCTVLYQIWNYFVMICQVKSPLIFVSVHVGAWKQWKLLSFVMAKSVLAFVPQYLKVRSKLE